VPRKPRELVEGGIYHAFARGVRGVVIYRDNQDRSSYLRRLGRVTKSVDWLCLAYCLMGNHVHLLVETPRANLDAGMHLLHGGYAQEFNKRHGFVGHLFQSRYGAVRTKTDEQLWSTAAYIARNPVEAGLCESAVEWPWSSYQATMAGHGPPWLATPRLMQLFGGGDDALETYARLVGGAREFSVL
jgi:REP element-mobilizing transposase RayT